MHSSFTHILFNMFGVFMFGAALEYRLGSQKFFIYYLLTGFGAVILHFLSMYGEGYELIQQIEAAYNSGQINSIEYSNAYFNTFNVTVGASGALFGLLAGFGTLFPNQRIMLLFPPIPIKAKYFVLFYAGYELFRGVSNAPGDNIAHFAHLGGALFGFLIIRSWKKKGYL